MIEVRDLKKSYGSVKALRGVGFNISAGEIVGLLGPNGAGKTTIIKTLTGYLQPDSGVVLVNDLDVLTQTRQVQTHIGYLPENAPLYPELSVQNYLKMIADLRDIPEEEQVARISEAVHAVGLEEFLTRPIGHLSKGYRQRVGLAQAIIHRPKLLILDEPTIGLDPTQIVEIRKLIRRLSAYSTVLFSTHILPEVEMLCDRVIIIMNGEIKVNSKLNDLALTSNVNLVLEQTQDAVLKSLEGIQGVEAVKAYQTVDGFPAYHIDSQKDADISPSIYQLAAKQDWPLRELRRDARTLESVFNELAVAE